jgi:hypothetical protein
MAAALWAGAGDTGWSWAIVDAPAAGARRHLEIVAPGAERVWLNGTALGRNELGGYDVGTAVRRKNVVVRRPGGEVRLVSAPRVHLARAEVKRGRLVIWVRNTLENTSNVFVGIAAGATVREEVTATVPPGVVQAVEFAKPEGPFPGEWDAVLDKEEEAMEGPYRQRVPLAELVRR